jgi:hypothetical protein
MRRGAMKLLSILDEQVELLAKEGRSDLSRFFDSLESHSITPNRLLERRGTKGVDTVVGGMGAV